ncbi:MAG: phytase [Bacteroidia bacterium]|nr:phytase [Bacteroidia bacterium]
MKSHFIILAFVLSAVVQTGCGSGQKDTGQTPQNSIERILVTEAWNSPRNETDNVDSPAFWYAPDGNHIVIATAKSTDRLLVYDAKSGKLLRTIGTSGSGIGQLKRPNGIAIVDDLAIIVERDNHRIQVFRLPDGKPLGYFGADQLIKPYGIAVIRMDKGFSLYVTDNYETADEMVPPASELGRRVKRFSLTVTGDVAEGNYLGSFGETTGAGVLQIVESICADTVHNVLLIADEDSARNDVKVYDLDGRFTGDIVGKGLFKSQPEGIVLYECPDGGGYWVMTDQGKTENNFLVFDRVTFEFVGMFHGSATRNTDGIVLTQRSFDSFAAGAFFAIHDDGNVSAFDWSEIAKALKLARTCVQ